MGVEPDGERSEDLATGRGARFAEDVPDAPDIDGKVYLDGITDLNPGDFVEAEVTAADDYDLWAG